MHKKVTFVQFFNVLNMKKTNLFLLSFLLISFSLKAQKPQKLSSNQIYEKDTET